MFDEPNEDPIEQASDAAARAREKGEELRADAERFAVFEGMRKFDAQLLPGMDQQVMRDIQKMCGRLEKAKNLDSPVLPDTATTEAAELLNLFDTKQLSTNDYHIARRPGEVMIVRWLIGDQVDSFYTRLQAHFDAAIQGLREDERQNSEWKQDPQTLAYLDALDTVEVKMAERYLRDPIRTMKIFVLSTQSADELNIAYLADYIMGVPAAEIVGQKSAPPDEPSETDLAWFYKLFSLRGLRDGVEQMCFFTFLQKSDDLF